MWACLSDCCFLGNGKWNKETPPKKVQQCRTTNYERGGGVIWRRRRVSHTAAMCPPNPVLPLSCSSILCAHCCFSPSSVVSYLRCSVFFHLRGCDDFVLRALVSHRHIRDITLGRCCRWWLGLWVLYMFYFLQKIINSVQIDSCVFFVVV